jgi:hypothetical protein
VSFGYVRPQYWLLAQDPQSGSERWPTIEAWLGTPHYTADVLSAPRRWYVLQVLTASQNDLVLSRISAIGSLQSNRTSPRRKRPATRTRTSTPHSISHTHRRWTNLRSSSTTRTGKPSLQGRCSRRALAVEPHPGHVRTSRIGALIRERFRRRSYTYYGLADAD